MIERLIHDGFAFDVVDAGPADGEPVILLHGFPERASSWDQVGRLLHAHGLRTVAPDQRGYSPGARPRRRRDYAIAHLVGDVLALIERVGGSAHVVGHDWGAAVAWMVAARHPEATRSLTAVSVPHPAAFMAAMPRGQLLQSWYMAMFQVPNFPERLLSRRGGKLDEALRKGGSTQEEIDRFQRDIVEYGALRGGLNWYRALPLSPPSWSRTKVRVPTTFVWSDQDVALGRWGAEHAGDWVEADYEFVDLKGVSHWIPTHAPEALAEAILERVLS